MENWEKELQQHNLQKAINTEFGYVMPIEELLEKAAPIGTRKTWQGGREFVKTAEGWKPVPKGSKKEGEKETEDERLQRLVDSVPDNGGTAHLMRKQMGVKEKSNESKIEFKGEGTLHGSRMHIDGKEVVVDRNRGYVKLGGRGVGMLSGALYPAGTGSDQLQGIKYTHTVLKMQELLKEGKSLFEVDRFMSTQYISSGSSTTHGATKEQRQQASAGVWKTVKEYLGLKIGK